MHHSALLAGRSYNAWTPDHRSERPRENLMTSRRSRRKDAAVLVPAGVAAAGLGVVTTEYPMVGLGMIGFGVLMMLPWAALWVLFLFSSTLNKLTYTVAGATVRPSQVLLIP